MAPIYDFTVQIADNEGAVCTQELALNVTAGCADVADWVNAPGTCRVRIKDYYDGLIPFVPGACAASAGPLWDGTFPIFVPGYGFAPDLVATPQMSTMLLHTTYGPGFLGFTSVLWHLVGHYWVLTVACLAGSLWGTSGDTGHYAGSITGVYNKGAGWAPSPATLEIEAYIP